MRRCLDFFFNLFLQSNIRIQWDSTLGLIKQTSLWHGGSRVVKRATREKEEVGGATSGVEQAGGGGTFKEGENSGWGAIEEYCFHIIRWKPLRVMFITDD